MRTTKYCSFSFRRYKSKSNTLDVFLIRLKSLDDTYACNFTALSPDVICDTISSIKYDAWVGELKRKNIVLSDVECDDGPIDILIGADVAGKLLTGKKHELSNGLSAFETHLGWTVMGKMPSKETDAALIVTSMFAQEADISDLWRLDVLGITDPIQKQSKETRDEQTRDFLIQTAKFNEDGRYEVRLPFIENHAPIPSNYDLARSRLTSTVNKLKKQDIFNEYNEIILDWLNEGIVEKVNSEEIETPCHYLPHRPVIKNHGTTKMRPVFDASAFKEGYPALNHCLEKGPNLIELVPSLLNRFRENEIGVIADIKRAFLQIAVCESDRDYLRFLWTAENKIEIFRHCRVVFGLACSPFLLSAIIEIHLKKCIEKAEINEKVQWTKRSLDKLKKSYYVDNCVTSVDNYDELDTFMREAKAAMLAGGFELRAWESSKDNSSNTVTTVLGVLWDKEDDTISVNPAFVDVKFPKLITKRAILSITQKIFDPIGITAPVSLKPKLILQALWSEKIDWDSEVKGLKKDEFCAWANDLHILKQLRISRSLGKGILSLHVFGDASGSAYAAVVFARVEFEGRITVNLLNARSRVAPKNVTIPRLELMAASIAVRLAQSVIQSLTRDISRIFYWTDSTTVLSWIKRDSQWNTFVYNRVREIRLLSKQEEWGYIPSAANAADLPSRGCDPAELLQSEWWLGPEWLYKNATEWPTREIYDINESEIQREIKKSALVQLTNLNSNNFKARDYFRTYTQLIRFVAWVTRFLNNCRAKIEIRKNSKQNDNLIISDKDNLKKDRQIPDLSALEIKNAEIKVLKELQEKMLLNCPKEKLSSFKTLVDENGLYVLKTKISNRKDDPAFLAPILLDNDDDIIYLMLRETHEKLGHVGALIIMSNIRERFWIISMRKIIRSILAKCVICNRYKAKRVECEAPALPLDRVRDAKVFETVGIDFAGPVFLQEGGKAWICIFTCAVYRAVHFELSKTLSIEGFIECARRFIARRGRPRAIWSDNASNYRGTNSAFDKLNWDKIEKFFSTRRIEWYFNPPSAPWWGGWWERLIGVLKTILRKTLGKTSLTYESITTVLCEAEATINSRPLTYMSENPDDLNPLSPSSFLNENEEYGVPEFDMLYHGKLNKKLQYRQKVLEDLRARFRTEYLGNLLLKSNKKESRESREISIGDIVLIGDDTFKKRTDWPLARVIDRIVGRDGKHRVFVLKTKNGTLKRPIQRLYPLEISEKSSDLTNEMRKKIKDVQTEKNPSKNKHNVNDKKENCNTNNKTSVIVTTRSGRTIKKPERYSGTDM